MANNTIGPKEYDLTDATSISLKIDEHVTLILDFKRDVSDLTFEVNYSEYRWPYAPSSYDVMSPGSLSPSRIDSSGLAGGILRIEITPSDAELFRDRRIDLRVIANDGTKTWCVSSRVVSSNKGD
jgi:hypothetical protein